MIILFVIYLVLKTRADHYLLPWEKVIANDKRSCFRSKHLREPKYGSTFDFLLLPVPKGAKFNENRMYLYLFIRSFVRGRDAFSIILRLVIIAIILMVWLSQPVVSLIIGSLFMYIILLQMSQFYTQQACGQVWPVSDTKVIAGYQVLNRLMIIIAITFTIVYVIKHHELFFLLYYSL